MIKIGWILQAFFLLQVTIEVAEGLRLTGTVIPEYAILSKAALLECHFALENDSLYALKWYKDNHEFFRFKPSDDPPITTFPVVGVSVNVNQSSVNVVQLEPISLSSLGIYKCEVSADAPSFQTLYDDQHMRVLVLPERGPTIVGAHPWYNIGDQFSAKCHVHRSFPSPQMTWFINDEPLDPKECDCITAETFEAGKASDGTPFYSSTSHIKFQVDSHYFRDGSIVVECQAKFLKTSITLKTALQANIKSGFGFRQFADTLSGSGSRVVPLLVYAKTALLFLFGKYLV